MAVAQKTNANEDRGSLLVRGVLSDIWILGKPRITGMVLFSTAIGFLMAQHMSANWNVLWKLLAATWLLGSGVNALNQYLERDTDAFMTRTRNRPLPAGRMRPLSVAVIGITACSVGLIMLGLWINPISAIVGVVVMVSYVAVYTPMKRMSPLNTLVGGLPGALPPLLGWVAARGTIDLEAWSLFLILFFWQPTHFMPIAYMYREEYTRAGLVMMSVEEPERAPRVMILYTIALIPFSIFPSVIGLTGSFYTVSALLLGAAFLASAIVHARSPSRKTALLHLKVSVIYLPLLWGVMLYDLQGVV